MKIPLVKNLVKNLAGAWIAFSVSVIGVLGLAGCGGGGGGDDGSAPTVRPKTMDGIILKLDNSAQFEFLRSTSGSSAVNNGDEETGSFIYTSFVGLANLRYYDNNTGSQSNFLYPQSVNVASYKYRAINDSSGVLTLTGTGSVQNIVYTTGNGFIFNNSLVIPFVRGSYDVGLLPNPTNVVQMDLTFSSNGQTVAVNTVTLSLPDSLLASTFDTVRVPCVMGLAAGGLVPVNYNPTVDPLRPSKIAPASLTNLRMTTTNGIPDPAKDFSIQFTADATTTAVGGSGSNPDEVGRGLLRVAGTVVDIALDYTWRRIGGTDTGELVLSNIPDSPSLPFDSSLNGTYTLSFFGSENGRYDGGVDGDTADPADVSGTFIIR